MLTDNRGRRLDTLVVLVALAAMAAPSSARAQETQDTMKLAAPLRTARAALTAAYVALDARAAGRHFSDSAVVNFQGQVLSGRAAVDGWLTNSLQGISSIRFGASTFTVAETEVTERSTYTVVVSDGASQEGTTEATWKRQPDGSWKVIRLTAT